ncbi:MAG TPA: Gfo/Idh/MocA family oxidoreductase [Roseiflexaceae bacterium]|nr:Gfo/Idh/MocA family oxidoreductase [Roseiflexaceae bacterium]
MSDGQPIRWGIIGTGSIAKQFARGLESVPDARLEAVGSRTGASAEHFANRFQIPRRYDSYEALVADPAIDVIYIGTPHPFHQPHTELCLRAGKAVLCEKPFAINRREAQSMIDTAQAQGVFLMEAMWTRFLPLFTRLRDQIATGAIGEVRMVWSDFGFRTGVNPASRLFNPNMGGGALLDVGVYPVSLASLLLGPPSRVTSLAQLSDLGVDEQAGIVLGYPGGQIAMIATAIRTQTPMETTIMGTTGSIRIHSPSWSPTKMTITHSDGGEEVIEAPYEGNGYNYEAAEVGRCLRAGLLESPSMTHAETLQVMDTMDKLREQWGLRYPME